MQGFRLAAISDVEKIWTPTSHPAISRCDKNLNINQRLFNAKTSTIFSKYMYIRLGE